MSGAGIERTGFFRVAAEFVLFVLQRNVQLEAMNDEASLVQIKKTTDEIGVVVKKTVYARTARPIAAPKLARLRIVKMRFEKLSRSLRAFEIARLIESLAGPRQGGDHHAVPGCDNLIVERRLRTARARHYQRFAGSGQLVGGLFNG